MKSDTTNSVLNMALAVLVLLGVVFALWGIFRTRDLRNLTQQAGFANNALMRIQALAGDAAAYNQKAQDPVLARALLAIQKPANAK